MTRWVAESDTARTDDDLKLSIDWGAGTQDLFDHVRTLPDLMIEVEVTVTVTGAGGSEEFPLSFSVTSLDEIKGYIDMAVAGIDPADDASLSYEVSWTTAVTVTEADNCTVTGNLAGDGTILLDGDEVTLVQSADGDTATLRLPAGEHEVKVVQTFGSQSEFDGADFGLTWSGADTGGREVAFPEDAPALTDGFFDMLAETLNSIGDVIAESGTLPLDFGPIIATPTLTFNLGIGAELGWNIELPGVGRTVTSLPVTFALNSTDEVEAGGTLTAWASDLLFLAPTTRNFLLEMGSAEFTSEFSLPETLLKDVGVFIGTSSVAEDLVEEVFGADSNLAKLNSALNGLVSFKLVLDKAIPLDEIVGAVDAASEASGARDPEKAFDLDGFIEGLYSGKVNLADTLYDLLSMVGDGDFEGAFSLFYRVAGLGHDAEEPGEEPAPEKEALTVTTAEGEEVTLTPTEVLELAKAAALYAETIGTKTGGDTATGSSGDDTVAGAAGADTTTGSTGDYTTTGGTADPSALISFAHSTPGTINVAVSQVEELLSKSGLSDVLDGLKTLFTEGYEILPGLTVSGNLPIGEAYSHYGWDGLLDDDVAAEDDAREPPGPIVTETTIELLTVSADVREMYFGAAIAAIDKQLERDDLTSAERKALLNAKIAASIQPLMLEIMEEGASAELTLNQGPVLHALTDLFLGLIDDVTSGLNSMVDFFVPGDFDSLKTDLANNELINLAFEDPDQFKVLTREPLEPVAEFMKQIPDFINDFIKGIGTAFVNVTPDTSATLTLTDEFKAWLPEAVAKMYANICGIPEDAIRVELTETGWEAYDSRLEDLEHKKLATINDGTAVRVALEQGTGMVWDGVQNYGEWLEEVVPAWWAANQGIPAENVQVTFLGGDKFAYAVTDTRYPLPEFKEVISISDAGRYAIMESLVSGSGESYPAVGEDYGSWLERVVPIWWEKKRRSAARIRAGRCHPQQ